MRPFEADGGSYRDPGGRVYSNGKEIYRIVTPAAVEEYVHARDSGLLEILIQKGHLVKTVEVSRNAIAADIREGGIVLRHERIPFISYPYEWSFPLLKAAALLTLDIYLEALGFGMTLSDASAYNIQFRGSKPIFIDILSLRRYREDEPWIGHKQFCEQFLNPLLLRCLFGVPHNAWFRGSLEGIETAHISRLLPWWRNISFNIFSHITLQSLLQSKAATDGGQMAQSAKRVRLPRKNFERMLLALRDWIAKLYPKETGPTVWQDYAQKTTYDTVEHTAKHKFVSEFCSELKPASLWDMGCNAGEYSQVALLSGARRVIGFDIDHGAIEKAYARARSNALDFLPLYLDSANPSPGQGWAGIERKSTLSRSGAQAVIALAFVHHLAIGRNIPLDMLVDWLISIAPHGIIEFVQKDDPMVRQLLTLREDIFPNYNQKNFEAQIRARAEIIRSKTVSASGRTLYQYKR